MKHNWDDGNWIDSRDNDDLVLLLGSTHSSSLKQSARVKMRKLCDHFWSQMSLVRECQPFLLPQSLTFDELCASGTDLDQTLKKDLNPFSFPHRLLWCLHGDERHFGPLLLVPQQLRSGLGCKTCTSSTGATTSPKHPMERWRHWNRWANIWRDHISSLSTTPRSWSGRSRGRSGIGEMRNRGNMRSKPK